MADKHTSIELPGDRGGYMAWGYVSRQEMIETVRDMAARDKEAAERVLSAHDEDFVVTQHIGVYRQKNVVRLLPDGSREAVHD